MITVTAPASDLALLDPAELRAAVGAVDGSLDAALAVVGRRAAARIMTECGIASDGVHPPTLLSEELEETLYLVSRREKLLLSRRFISEIASVVEDGVLLEPGEYQLHAEAGMLTRLRSDFPGCWRCSKVVVTYTAGFAADSIPEDLKAAAASLVQANYFEGSRDPLVKSETNEIPGVLTERRDYWVGGIPQSGSAGPVPETVAGLLRRFRNPSALA
jgi:hypothetical protein